MNILVLTPDRVGSSLLQRVITVFMANSKNKHIPHPVTNVHELTNGIDYYHSDIFNQSVLGVGGKVEQSLGEIVDTLKLVPNHSVVARLAHYQMMRRKDPIHEQIKFYEYLNENFYVIGCRRASVFEHALSWGINAFTKRLNAYSHKDKIDIWSDVYKTQITIPKEGFVKYLNAYKDYIKWSDDNFNVNQFFTYEEHMPSIEDFVHNLDCFTNKEIPRWEDMFGISWNKWNKCHRLLSDIGVTQKTIMLENSSMAKQLPTQVSEVVRNLPLVEQKFIDENGQKYFDAHQDIKQMVDDRILHYGIPIKLQTLVEKRMIVKNFNECATWYNEWACENGFNTIKDSAEIINQARDELKHWYEEIPKQFLLGDNF
jgi:hypothetical protein